MENHDETIGKLELFLNANKAAVLAYIPEDDNTAVIGVKGEGVVPYQLLGKIIGHLCESGDCNVFEAFGYLMRFVDPKYGGKEEQEKPPRKGLFRRKGEHKWS